MQRAEWLIIGGWLASQQRRSAVATGFYRGVTSVNIAADLVLLVHLGALAHPRMRISYAFHCDDFVSEVRNFRERTNVYEIYILKRGNKFLMLQNTML